MIKNSKKNKKGFTLVEVIIVLAIIAIIAAIAIPNLTKVREDSKRKADIQTIETMCRTIDTLLVDGTLKGSGTIEIDGGVATLGTGLTYDDGNAATTDDAAELNKYFAKVGDPQEKDKTKYKLTITADEVVTGETE